MRGCINKIDMKPLQFLNNIEKGRLLAGLFPERLPEILRAIQDGCTDLTRNELTLRPLWDNSLFRFDLWYRLAAGAAEAACCFSSSPPKGTQQLTEKIFSGHTALYTIDCIARHADTLPDVPENASYKAAVRMLFDHYTAFPQQGNSTNVEPKIKNHGSN